MSLIRPHFAPCRRLCARQRFVPLYRTRESGRFCALALLMLLVCVGAHAAEKDEDPTLLSKSITFDHFDQPLDTSAPTSQVIVSDGNELWLRARERVSHPTAGHGGGFFDATELISDDFRSAKNFHAERYNETDIGNDLQMIVAADEAAKEGDNIVLKNMRMIYFIPDRTPDPPASPVKPVSPKTGSEPEKNDKKPEKPGAAAAGSSEAAMGSIFMGGRMIVSAPEAIIDSITNEGRASGSVSIEIFAKNQPAGDKNPVAKLTSNKLRWCTWNEASTGSIELALYTNENDNGGADPLVSGSYILPQPDGTPSSVFIKGYGMIFEVGTFERLTAVADEYERMAGLTFSERNHAIFHSGIVMESTAAVASTMLSLNPPNSAAGSAAGPAAGSAAGPNGAAPRPPVAISKTIISCNGPALLDMCVVPPKQEGATLPLKELLMQRRFEFFNKVHMTKWQVDEHPAPPGTPPTQPTEMACGQLRMEYPPGVMPTPGTPPQIAEAVGGVNMHGVSTGPPATPGGAPAPTGSQSATMPPGPFVIDCDRIYHDGAKDNMFLVGTKLNPARVKDSDGEAVAQQFNFRQKTQTFSMPSIGPKKLVMHSSPPPPISANPAAHAAPAVQAAPAIPNVGATAPGGDTIITWEGLLIRKLIHIPVPQQADRIKEVMTFDKNVLIEQPVSGLKLNGQIIHVVRNDLQQVEFLDSTSDASLIMGTGEHAIGDIITVETQFGKNGLNTNLTTVTGSRTNQIKATLLKPGSAVRADKFIIDEQADTFRAFGGAVAVFKGPIKPEGAPVPSKVDDSKAIFKSIKFEQGGDLTIQCDGEFRKDGATHRVTLKKNVILRQPGLQLFGDEVYLTLDDPPSPAGPHGAPAPAARTPAAGNPEGVAAPPKALFSGDLKYMECFGNVDLINDTQWVQCDELQYDAEKEISKLKVTDPDNDVRIYLKREDGGTKLLSVKKSLDVDGKSGKYKPGGIMLMLPYKGGTPTPRDKNSSPAHFNAEPGTPQK